MNKKLFLPLAAAVLTFSGAVYAAPAKPGAYEYCMKDATKVGDSAIAECMKAENSRLTLQIYQEYDALSKNPAFQNWNNGSGMFRGRLKNLYETWSKYRDEFCDLYVLSMTNYTGTSDYNRQSCLLDANKGHLMYISSMAVNYNSTPD